MHLNNQWRNATGWLETSHAIITPVHKAGLKSDPLNFRPISVLTVFSKILERAQSTVWSTAIYRNPAFFLFSNQAFAHFPLHAQAQLTSGLTNVLSWLHANFLILNLEKMKIMLVGTYQRTNFQERPQSELGTWNLKLCLGILFL